MTVDLEPIGRRVEISPDSTLLEAAQAAGVDLVSVCGGMGICDGCRVQLISGKLTPPTSEEEAEFSAYELASGWRLACQAKPLSDVRIDVPPESLTAPQRLQIEGDAVDVTFDPVIKPVDIRLPPARLDDLRSDLRRLRDYFGKPLSIGVQAMGALSQHLREFDWSVRLAIRSGLHIVAALPPGACLFGLAVDIGTTGLAAYLVNLQSGETVAKTGAMNPQIAFGEDVVSRIVYSNDHPEGRRTLQKRLVDTLNELVDRLCVDVLAQPSQIVEAVWVGNTVMHHIAVGLPVRQLGEAPYVPVIDDALNIPAAQVGLHLAADAMIYLPPNIAGYVGADHVSMLLATGVWQANETTLAVDIGTNTEMTLTHHGRSLCCSCASGPAFEGAHIRFGMRAAPGAIERIQMLDGTVHIQTIGGKPPIGICGSGILDAVAVMVEQGVVDRRGVLAKTHPLVDAEAFVLTASAQMPDGQTVTINRQDVAEIQLAKAAIRAGIEILLCEMGIEAEAIQSFVIAGAFGMYIRIESAVRIGMFPPLPLERFKQVGNAAGIGACHMLVSNLQRQNAARLTEGIEYIELTTYPDFQNIYVSHMGL